MIYCYALKRINNHFRAEIALYLEKMHIIFEEKFKF